MELSSDTISAIFSKTNMHNGDTTKCWTWSGAHSGRDLRPTVRIDRKLFYVSRVMYQIYYGRELGSNEVVRHKCDNEKCVNPFHLECGTLQQNAEDRILRRRIKIEDYSKVQQCRVLCAMGFGNTVIALQLGVKVSWVADIKYQRRHKMLPWPDYDKRTGVITDYKFDKETGEIINPVLKSEQGEING